MDLRMNMFMANEADESIESNIFDIRYFHMSKLTQDIGIRNHWPHPHLVPRPNLFTLLDAHHQCDWWNKGIGHTRCVRAFVFVSRKACIIVLNASNWRDKGVLVLYVLALCWPCARTGGFKTFNTYYVQKERLFIKWSHWNCSRHC